MGCDMTAEQLYQKALRVLLNTRWEKPQAFGTAMRYAELTARELMRRNRDALARALWTDIETYYTWGV